MKNFDFAGIIEPVAKRIFGEPNRHLSSREELRFGTNGSVSVMLAGEKRGTWYDHEANEGGGVMDLLRLRKGLANGAALEWLRSEIRVEIPDDRVQQPRADSKGGFVAIYDYFDQDGVLSYQVCRKEPKTFLQRRPDGNGNYVWSTKGIPPLPYRLPELLASDAESDPVFIAEGEKDVDALRILGVVASCNAGGAGKWKDGLNEFFRGRDVIILPDNDPQATMPEGEPRTHRDGRPVLPGQDHAQDVAKRLQGIARRVRVLELPDLPSKGDPFDWIAAGGTLQVLVELVEAAPDWEPRKRKEKAGDEAAEHVRARPHLPLIHVVAGMLDVMTTEAEAALLRAGVPVYQRGRDLVRPISVEVAASDGRKVKAAGLVDMNAHSIVDTLCTVSDWEKFDGRSEEWVRTNPPKQVADILLSRQGQWKVPVIAGVITTPTMRPDGSLVTAHGYDAATRLYHMVDPTLKLHAAVQNPTKDTALGALGALRKLLVEFPFVVLTVDGKERRVSEAVTLAGMITPVVRGALPVAPLTAFRANTAGSGKSYLADIISTISTGRVCPVASVAAGDGEEETEKRLTGLLLGGYPIISLDNVNGELGGDLLCQAVERPLVQLRRLGGSDMTEVECRATIFATGNNLRVRGDMVRRTLVADLDAGMERPELREFKGDPVATVLADRGRYVSACLIIVRAYLLAGQPDKLKPIASFGAWSDLVRSALVWLGCDDPAESMEVAREDDPELGSIREVMLTWDKAIGGSAVTVKKVIDVTEEQVVEADAYGNRPQHGGKMIPRNPELLQALVGIAGTRGVVDARRLGRWLMQTAGRVLNIPDLGARRFKKEPMSAGSLKWKLEAQTDGKWS